MVDCLEARRAFRRCESPLLGRVLPVKPRLEKPTAWVLR